MSDLTFGLLVLGIPLVVVAAVFVLAGTDPFLRRHPTLSWIFDFSFAGYFVAVGLFGLFQRPTRIASSTISAVIGVLLAARFYVRFRSRKSAAPVD